MARTLWPPAQCDPGIWPDARLYGLVPQPDRSDSPRGPGHSRHEPAVGRFQGRRFRPAHAVAWRLTFGTAFIASFINAFFGLIVAWVLVRYDFPGRRILDALIDVPFALPTAVSGIALTAIYAPNGWVGQLLQPLGIKAVFSPLGIVIALTFIGLPVHCPDRAADHRGSRSGG